MPEGNHTRDTRSPHSAARTMSEHQPGDSKSAVKSWDELEYEMQFGPLVIEMERREGAEQINWTYLNDPTTWLPVDGDDG